MLPGAHSHTPPEAGILIRGDRVAAVGTPDRNKAIKHLQNYKAR